jgi:hypothetical protein
MRSINIRGLWAVLATVVIAVAGALVAPEIKAQQVSAVADTAEIDARLVDAKGAWSPGKNYVTDDLVTSRGSTWRAKRNNKGKVPGSTQPSTAADWELFAAGFNPTGAWLGSKTYHANDLVTHDGTNWRAKRTSNNKTPPTSAADWQEFAAQGDAGATGTAGATGATGAAGPAGSAGAAGANGANGTNGTNGAQGPQGPAGSINAVPDGSVGAPAIKFTSSTTTGIFSPATGKIALSAAGTLFLHDIGSNNAALGFNALAINTGGQNTALGFQALAVNTTGSNNTSVGFQALDANIGGGSNTAVGNNALGANTTGAANTGVGSGALFNNISGGSNTALGLQALTDNTGSNNTAVGRNALTSNSNGNNNIALGRDAGLSPTAPENSIFIGNQGVGGDTTTIKIGNTQTSTFIAGIAGATVANDTPVMISTVTGRWAPFLPPAATRTTSSRWTMSARLCSSCAP